MHASIIISERVWRFLTNPGVEHTGALCKKVNHFFPETDTMTQFSPKQDKEESTSASVLIMVVSNPNRPSKSIKIEVHRVFQLPSLTLFPAVHLCMPAELDAATALFAQ